jgi:hypothetical protein
MTNLTEIERHLNYNFRIQGSYTIDPVTRKVSVQGNVTHVSSHTKLPVQFEKVTGFFSCNPTTGSHILETLAGCPTWVGDNFDVRSNNLTSLEHAPVHVGKNFMCSNNKLTSLMHVPAHIPGSFNCSKNQLTNLMHGPTSVGDDYSCSNNPFQDLTGMADQVGRNIWITWHPDVPLLRTLVAAQGVEFMNVNDSSAEVQYILRDPKFMGKGKAAAIACAVALTKAGFKGNARW